MKEFIFVAAASIFCQAPGRCSSYINPVEDSNHPDPGVLALNSGGYGAVSTSNYAMNNDGPAFPMMYSDNLVLWEERGHVFPQGGWPVWAYKDMWAPELHWVGDNYHVYFSARKSVDDILAIGVARAKDPENPFGEYEDLGYPIIQDEKGVIDIHFFRDPKDNTPYLIWKTDDNAIGQASSIYIQRVLEDGITLDPGAPVFEIMHATEEEDLNVVEGPWVIFREPFYYMFFSGGGFAQPEYHVTVARSVSVVGPYERFQGDYFLTTDTERLEAGENCTFVGPGHGSVVQNPSQSSDWYVYHSWRYDMVNVNPPGRVLNIDKIEWNDTTGWPFIGVPSDYQTDAP